MTCVTLELKSQEKKEIEYEQQKKSLMEDIHFNIIFILYTFQDKKNF